MSLDTSSQEIRPNKIKEVTQSMDVYPEENIDIHKINLSSYDLDSNNYILKYNNNFYMCKIQNEFKDYKMINKNNILRVLKNKIINYPNFNATYTSTMVKKNNDTQILKIYMSYYFNVKMMNIEFTENITFEFTKMTDQLSILNERLKNFEKIENEEENNKNLSTYFYELFTA